MKDWKFLLAVIVVAAVAGKMFLPNSNHAAPPQAISIANGAPSNPCTPPLIYVDSASSRLYVCIGNNTWQRAIPSGTTVMSLTGCGAGWNEVSALSGQIPMGTVAANGDVGTAGGSLVLLAGVSPTTKVIFCQLP